MLPFDFLNTDAYDTNIENEAMRKRGKKQRRRKKKRREKSLRYGDEKETEFVRPGGNEAWDTQREIDKTKRQNDKCK